MKMFAVEVQQTIYETATVTVQAEDAEHASDLARDAAFSGEIEWSTDGADDLQVIDAQEVEA